jgi:hypothetical protein
MSKELERWHTGDVFVRVTRTGDVSCINIRDRRAWPWICWVALQRAQDAPNEWSRVAYLNWAERLATRRSALVMRRNWMDVLKQLVTACEFCGKPATHLQGWGGRCRSHRTILGEARLKRIQNVDRAYAEVLRADEDFHQTRRRGQLTFATGKRYVSIKR